MYTVALFAISPTSFWSQNVVSDSAASALLSLVRRLPDISAVRSLVTPGTGASSAADVVGGSMAVVIHDKRNRWYCLNLPSSGERFAEERRSDYCEALTR